MLRVLSSTSKINSRWAGSAFDDGCSTEASVDASTAAGTPTGLSASDAFMND